VWVEQAVLKCRFIGTAFLTISCGRNLSKRLFLFLSSVVVVSVILGYFLLSTFFGIRDVSIIDVVFDPESFDGVRVQLQGYVVDTGVYMFGPKYVLRDFENEVEIALGGEDNEENVDLEPYVSFVFNGGNYTQIAKTRTQVVGHVCYLGWVTDFSSFLLDIQNAETVIDVHQ
jgi:hypothetical protein